MAVKDVKFILSFDDKGTAILKKATSEGVKTLGQFSGKAKDAEKALMGLAKGSAGTEKGMSKLKGMLKSTWGQMAMGMGVMTGVTGLFRSVSRAITSTIATGREFERSWANTTTMMTTTGQVIDDTGQSMNDMKQELLAMSPLLGGAKGLSDGLYQVLSASVPVGESLEFLSVASKSAQAGVTDISTSVDALTTVYNAYGAEMYSVQNISDIMFQTVKRGKLTYETLAGALGTVVPIASQVGVSFEEVAGAMATMTRQGIDVNTSTVALRQTLVSVLKPTKDAMDTARQLGINFTATALRTKGFGLFLKDVSDKVGDNAEAMTMLFGNVRALMGVFALAGSKMDEYTEDVQRMRQAIIDGTATNEAFTKQLQNADAMLRILKTILDKMKIAIWEGIVKPFQETILKTDDVTKAMEDLQKKAIEFGTRLGQSIGKVIKFFVDFRGTIVSVLKVLGVLFVMKKVNTWATGFGNSILGLAKNFKMFESTLLGTGGTITKVFNVLKIGIGALGKAMMAFVASPVGIVITALTALGVAGYMLIKHWDKVKAFFVNIWTTIKGVFVGAMNAINGLLPDWAKGILNVLVTPWKASYLAIKTVIGLIIKVVGFLWKTVFGELKKFGVDMVNFFTGVFNSVKSVVQGAVNFINKLAFWKKFKKDFKDGFDSVKREAKLTTAVLTDEWRLWAEEMVKTGKAMDTLKQIAGAFPLIGNLVKDSGKTIESSLESERKTLVALVKERKISYNEGVGQLEGLIQKYKDAGLAVPESLGEVADALQEQWDQIQATRAEWEGLLADYRKLVPSTRDIAKQTKALATVIEGYVKQGSDAKTVTELFEKQITKLYAEAEVAKKLFGTEIPPALEEMNKRLKTSDTTVAVLSAHFKDMGDILKQAPKEWKQVERAFVGVDASGNDVVMSMSQVRKTAQALGVTFKSDLRKQLANLEQGFADVMTTGDVFEEDQAQMILQIVGLYKKLGLEVPEKYEDMMDELAKKTREGKKNILAEMEKLGQLVGILGEQIGGNFGSIITTVGVGIQQAVSTIANGVKGVGNVLGSIAPILGNLGGQIGSFISKQEENFSQLGSSIGSTIGGIFGPLGKAIGSLAGGLLGGLFGKKKKKTEEERMLEQFNNQVNEAKKSMSEFGKITDATAEAIAESRKEYSGWVAEALNMSRVMQDVGVNQNNINRLWGKAHGLISAYEQGLVDNATASQELGKQFRMLVDGAKDLGLEGSKAMTDFIAHVKASGLEVAELTEYINDQLGIIESRAMSASDGLQAMAEMLPIDRFTKWKDKQKEIMDQMEEMTDKGSEEYKTLQDELDKTNNKLENITNNTKRQLATLESQALSVFNAMIANGASYQEAMTSIGPTLDQIIQAQTDMGIEAGLAIQELLKIREVQTEHQNLFNAIDGNLAVLNALANTGSLTQQAMMDAGQQTKNYYKQLMKAGLDSNQALAQMAPTLQQLKYYAEEHGLAIDNATQKLIDQAEQAGLMGESQMETTDIMLAGFGLIIQALGQDIPEAMQESIDKMNELEHSVHGSGVTGAMEILSTVADETLSGMNTQMDTLSGKFSTLEGGVYNIQTALNSLDAPELDVKVGYSLDTSIPTTSNKKTKSAQSGYDGFVRNPVQPFVAHKGEYVKVWRKDEVQKGEHQGGSSGNIVVHIEPLVIPKENENVVNFIVKKIERGQVRVPTGAVRG